MTAHHFFVEPAAISDEWVEISGSEAHHARVLRVRKGEAITVADGTGRVCEAVVSQIGETVGAEVRRTVEVAPLVPALTLCQALTKSDRFEVVVEKATELGVCAIVPFQAERSVVRWDARKQAKAKDRWTAVAQSAAKQSRAPAIPFVGDVAPDLKSAAASSPPPFFVLHEEAGRRLRDALPAEAPGEATIVVGPEGGLTPDELAAFDDRSVVSLGPRVLRTETAGLVGTALVTYAYGNLG